MDLVCTDECRKPLYCHPSHKRARRGFEPLPLKFGGSVHYATYFYDKRCQNRLVGHDGLEPSTSRLKI